MPWYAWLLIILVIGSLIGALLIVLRTAKPLDLDAEQLKRVRERKAEMEAKDAQEDRER